MFGQFSFSVNNHIFETVISSILTVAIFLKGLSIYKRTQNEKVLIIGYAAILSCFLAIIHLIYSVSAETSMKQNIYYYTQYFYHTLDVLSFAVLGLLAALYTPKAKSIFTDENKAKVPIFFVSLLILEIVFVEAFKSILPSQFELLTGKFIVLNPSFEVINNALFILTAFIFADILKLSGRKKVSLLVVGYFILGIGTIYLYTPNFLDSIYRLFIHLFRNLGYFCILLGLKDLPERFDNSSFRQKILTYPAVLLLIFSFLYFSICFILFKVELPLASQYVFIALFLITLFFAYSFSLGLSAPISETIKYVESLKPDEEPTEFENIRDDEIGLLIDKIKDSAERNWQYFQVQKENQLRIQKLNEIETSMRIIIEKIRSSLDIEETLSVICEETAKAFNVQRVAITMFPEPNDFKVFEIRKEYKTVSDVKGVLDLKDFPNIVAMWGETLIPSNKVIAFDNVIDANASDEFKDFYLNIGIKSIIGVAIKKGDKIWGTLILSEYTRYRHWTEEEKVLLEAVADQVYIAINQAELFEQQKFLAERERISRNIIEILRTSVSKNVIKKQFVKNLGKLFEANRVFFADYDSKLKKFLPVDDNSEYLSNDYEKSFVGLAWLNSDLNPNLNMLLEKREVFIPDWALYSRSNFVNEKFLSLYNESLVKSVYSFPVLHQDKIIGYFNIEFTDSQVLLTEEEINRIRNICTQAGIALYQAELYENANEAIASKKKFIDKFSSKVKVILNNIVNLVQEMSLVIPMCENHDKFLNKMQNLEVMIEKLEDIINKTELKED